MQIFKNGGRAKLSMVNTLRISKINLIMTSHGAG